MAEAGTLHDAFIDELRDTYDAEKQLTKALPKLAKAARPTRSCGRRSSRTSRRRKATSSASNRCSRASTKRFAASTATASPGSSKKASRSWKKTSMTTTMDACLIAAGQRAEHYEMAAYGTLVAWAQAMGHTEAARLLQQTLDEEKAADKKLSRSGRGRHQPEGRRRGASRRRAGDRGRRRERRSQGCFRGEIRTPIARERRGDGLAARPRAGAHAVSIMSARCQSMCGTEEIYE